jgi:aspartate dehydrogenase
LQVAATLEAVKHSPVNLNVAASLSIAGIGPDATQVVVVADPHLERNIHEIEVTGDAGRFVVRMENLPSPDNAHTSYIAPLSALALLECITDAVQIGT